MLGYESYFSLNNVGSFGIIFALYLIKVVIILTIRLLMYTNHLKNSKRAKKLLKWLLKDTFYNQVLAICLESYFSFPITSYLHLKFSPEFHQTLSEFQPRSLSASLDEEIKKFDEDLLS